MPHLRSLHDGRALGHVLGQGLGGLVADEAVPQARDERVHALLVQHGELSKLVADLCRSNAGLQPAGSPGAPLGARSLRLPYASASSGLLAAWAALAGHTGLRSQAYCRR